MMKRTRLFGIMITFIVLLFSLSGCQGHLLADAWENTKTAFRYLQQGGRALFNGETESRLVSSRQEFFGEEEYDFIPLNSLDMQTHMIDYAVPQAKEVPGAPGGLIPGIEAFRTPPSSLASMFATINFATDQHTPKTKEALHTLHRMANYLKKHPGAYVFIEGHCDERASEAYNLALGTRRCNYIRNYLVKLGVSPDQLFTISYGKERPLALGHSEKIWAKNRRAEFKIYQQRTTL